MVILKMFYPACEVVSIASLDNGDTLALIKDAVYSIVRITQTGSAYVHQKIDLFSWWSEEKAKNHFDELRSVEK